MGAEFNPREARPPPRVVTKARPERSEGPAGPSPAPTSDPTGLLGLQASAGNHAVAQLVRAGQAVSVQKEGAAPTLDSRALAVTLQPAVEKDLADARSDYETVGSKRAELKLKEDAGGLDEEEKQKDAELAKAEADLEKRIDKAVGDLRLLNEPGGTDAAFNELLVRRQANVSLDPTTETKRSGWRAADKGFSSSAESVRSEVIEGTSVEAKRTTTKQLDLVTPGSLGYSSATDTKLSAVSGSQTTSTTGSDVRKLVAAAGDLTYTRTESSKLEDTDSAADTKSTSASSTSRSWGTGGYTKSTETSEGADTTIASNKNVTSYTRGGGQIGQTSSETKRFGTVDADGNLIKGNEMTTTRTGGAIAGPGGVGAFGATGADLSQTHAKGVKTGQSVGMDGKFVVDVAQVDGKEPPQYRITLTINLGARVGASGGLEKETDAKDKSGVGLTGTATASVTGTFTHTFSAEETQRYLGDLAAKGTGGAQKELRVLELAAAGSIADAQQLLNVLEASVSDADAAKGMAAGDSAEVGATGTLGGKLTATGNKGPGGVGFEVGYSKSGTLKHTVSRTATQVVVTVAVVGATTSNLGGSASYGVASGGYGVEATDSEGQSVTFTLDPSDPQYTERFNRIGAADSVGELKLLAGADPSLVGSRTESTGTSSTGTTKAGAGPASLEISETHEQSESTTTDKSGKQTHTYSGGSGGGASVSVLGGPKISYSTMDTVSGTVGPDNKAAGDASTATSEADVGASIDKLKENLEKAPLSTAVGLVTGGTQVMQQRTEVAGMKLSDDDYKTIAAVAQDPHAWQKAVVSPRVFEEWMALRHGIEAAGDDRQEITRLLAAYAAHDDGAAKAVQHIVRPPGSGRGGALFDWPGDLSAEQASFASLVDDDPLGPVHELEQAGKDKAALDSANDLTKKLDDLVAAMQSKKDKFTDGTAFGEMLARAASRRGDIAKEAAIIGHRLAPAHSRGGSPALPAASAVTPEDQEADKKEIDEAAAQARLVGYQKSLFAFLGEQTRAFGIVQAEQAKGQGEVKGVWNTVVDALSKPDVIVIANALSNLWSKVYPDWDAAVADARKATQEAGIDPNTIQPVPARSYCNSLNRTTFGSDLQG